MRLKRWKIDSCFPRQRLPSPPQTAAWVKPAHIVVVVEEDALAANAIGNVTQAAVFRHLPYFNQLASTGLVYNNSHGLNTTAQDGEMDYLALYSGSTQGVTDDSNHGIFTAPTLASSLNAAGLTFQRVCRESAPTPAT